jgi:hypothetical protein
MDIPTALFIFSGIVLLLIPLDYISSVLFGSTDQSSVASYYSLIVPGIGTTLLSIGLLAYHKNNLQNLFIRACQDIEQTGFGRGIGNSLVEAFRPLMFDSSPNTSGGEPNIVPISHISPTL